MSNTAVLLDKAYEHPEKVPWENSTPPEELVRLVDAGQLKPSHALDIGCGTGHFSIYLARHGFTVTGIDISANAIAQARKNAATARVKATFKTIDASNVDTVGGRYNFALEWGLLHFLMPEFRQSYIHSLAQLMNGKALYMVLTFNDQSPEWGGPDLKYRVGLTGPRLYYSSMDELLELYQPYFTVLESRIRPTFFQNSGNEHLENYLLLERKTTEAQS